MAWAEQSGQNSWRVRYRRSDQTIGSIPGFDSEKEAEDYANAMETDQQRGVWIDPARGQLTIGESIDDWLDAQDVSPRTADNQRSIATRHILPRWQNIPYIEITNSIYQKWRKELLASGLAPVTVDGIGKQFCTMVSDAHWDRVIPFNPIRPRRRGSRRGRVRRVPRQIWAQSVEVLRLADQVAEYYGPSGAVLVVTAGWTGARWGELTGLQRHNMPLTASDEEDEGRMIVDPDIGALHESDAGRLCLGPPKTDDSARTITFPPFLVRLLRLHLTTHDHPHVFVTPDCELHRRSNFNRRAVRPCADGKAVKRRPPMQLHPVKPGLTFKGLRHSHKTWMIADGIPEIAQSERLGHKIIQDPVRETYSHVAQEVENRLLARLQERWDDAVACLGDIPSWRHIGPVT